MNRIPLKKILGKSINWRFVDGITSKGKSKKRWSNLDSNRKSTEAKACFPYSWFFFSLQEYKNEDVNQDYIIKSITHCFKDEKYGNTFEAIPIDHPVDQ